MNLRMRDVSHTQSCKGDGNVGILCAVVVLHAFAVCVLLPLPQTFMYMETKMKKTIEVEMCVYRLFA